MSSSPKAAACRARVPTVSRRPSREDALYSLKSMDGIIPKFGVGAVRINSDIVTWPKNGNNVRREKVPAAPGNRYVGLVLLFSTENGEPLAIFPDGVMQRMRVGAANGLGVKYLAREERQDRRHPRLRLAGRRAAHGGLRGDGTLRPSAASVPMPTTAHAFARQMSDDARHRGHSGRAAGGGHRRCRHRHVRDQHASIRYFSSAGSSRACI